MADISKVVLPNNSEYNIKDPTARSMPSVYYGTCSTAAATAAKVISVSSDQNFTLKAGVVIGVKFTNSNTADNVTFNVNSSGAKSLWYNTAAYTGHDTGVTGYAGRTIYYMYDGTYWLHLSYGYNFNSNTVSTAYSTTAAGTAAKAATCTNYNLLAKSYTILLISTTNTAASALTLNINSKGAKPIYINGSASSASNYTMPAGSYLVYYDGTNYYIRTDGKITGDITGDAATVNGKTVGVNVPANAVFTDTTYSEATTSAAGLMSSSDKTKLNGIATGAEANVQSDWNESSSSSDAYIKNKPTIPSDFPPKSHASTATTYGQGNASNYGHVKLSDTYTSSVSGGNAAGGVGASQNALYNVYANRAPVSHASTSTTYGKGNESYFGHVKLSDTYSSLVSGGNAAGGVGASQNALYNVYIATRNDGLDARLVGDTIVEYNADLNEYTSPGEYYLNIIPSLWGSDTGVINYPVNSPFRLRVEYLFDSHGFQTQGDVKQTFFPYDSSAFYVRAKSDWTHNTWSDWECISKNVQSDWNVSDTSSDAYIKNKPTIPTIPANIVTDASYVHTDNNYTTTEKNKLAGISTGAEVNVQSDWNVTDTASDAFIKNKPTIPTDTWKVFYGTCATAAATKDKAVTVASDQNFSLRVGTIVGVKFSYTNSYSSATANPITLNVNSTGAKNIWYNTTHSGAGNTGTNTTIYGTANRYAWFMYDGTYWVWIHYGVVSNSNTVPAAQCETAAATAAKAATCTNFVLKANSYLHFNIRYANTSATALTMNVNSTGAKAIYINGAASSTSNYTLPAGSYIAFYNGTYWSFRTDAKLPASISGDAATVNGHTVAVDVPSGAVFTDTIVTKTSELTNDSNFAVDASYVHTDNNYTTTEKNKLGGIATGAEVNVQSDWNVTDTASDAFIKNKPTIPSDFPPKSHASTATTYGQGNASNYGHIKLSDTYSSLVSGANAAGGVGASQNALYNVYDTMGTRINTLSNNITDGTVVPLKARTLDSSSSAGLTSDTYGNFIHKRSNTSDIWEVTANDGSYKALQVYFETGKLVAGGKTIVWSVGDTVNFQDNVVGGFISSSSKSVSFSIPCHVSSKVSSAEVTSMNVTIRHIGGGYAYMCYGSSNNQYEQLGSGRVSIWSSSQTVRTNGVDSLTCTIKDNCLNFAILFVNTLRTNAGTTVATNNVPMAIHVTTYVKLS